MSWSNAKLHAVVAAAVTLALAQAALAADKGRIRFNAADQTAAKAATLKMSDLGPGWKGGAKKPDLSLDELCPSKVSDLVLTGAAKSEFEAAGVMISSETAVLQSPAMVAADWQRTMGSAAYIACQRREYLKSDLEKKVAFVSFKKLPFPKLTRYAARYRVVADYGDPESSVRVLIDLIVLGHGRTEVSLVVSTAYADRAVVDAAEQRLARVVVSRITA